MSSVMEEESCIVDTESKPKSVLTPPTSNEGNKGDHSSDLSELELDDEDEEDEVDIEPDHYYGDGKVPVFKPTMDQFRSFKKFISKIDKYGMKSGIVKVVPPKEWTGSLPALDEQVKTIKVKNPITQEFSGTHGTYTQANIEKQRSYNLPQWKALTEESQHQPPAKRGEARKNLVKPNRSSNTAPKPSTSDEPTPKRRPGRPPRRSAPRQESVPVKDEDEGCGEEDVLQAPPTPTSPMTKSKGSNKASPKPRGKPKGSQPKSVSERRKYNRQEVADEVDEAAFKGFNYRFEGNDEFTAERCAELESQYWRSLTFAPPMYGADMPGSLFDENTTSWNVAKLENLLDVLGQKVPGVNTAYLYLGMWKATFAWHLEDVDLYSINYIHFGAPKQWYSISQEDARRFEAAMRSVWPNDAKNCSQFLRHKTYLISPALLQSQFNIKVNRLVHNEGEFVITFPYGYHSGYNLGYNCAESVNFATESWLDYGRIAKKCDCEADSVWIDVYDIERRLRGEPTPEYYEETDDEDDLVGDLPSPPASVQGKKPGRKRKRDSATGQAQRPAKKLKLRIRTVRNEPCILCPNDPPNEPLLLTDTGAYAHKICAQYTPETFILTDENGIETIWNVANIDKARMELKCNYCRSKKGACFQCSARKCTRPYHATCAMSAGVRVDHGMTPHYDNGIEYYREGRDFRCRFHRPKRAKLLNSEALETESLIRKACLKLQNNENIQIQYHFGDRWGDIFAGIVIENRPEEQTVLVRILPEGDCMEVQWKWVLVSNPDESQLPKPSVNAIPLPDHLLQTNVTSKSEQFGLPSPDDMFLDPDGPLKWAEFNDGDVIKNPDQLMVDFQKPNRLWYYLGKQSSETRAQYTHDPNIQRPNSAAIFGEPPRAVYGEYSKAAQNYRAYQYKPKTYQQTVDSRPANPSPLSSVNTTTRPTTQPDLQKVATVIPGAVQHRSSLSLGQGDSKISQNLASPAPRMRAYTGPQSTAPMANMSSSSLTGSTPSGSLPIFMSGLGEYSNRIKKYPYLKNCFLRLRPYTSHYPPKSQPENKTQSKAPSKTSQPYQAPDWNTPALSNSRVSAVTPQTPTNASGDPDASAEIPEVATSNGTDYQTFMDQLTESAVGSSTPVGVHRGDEHNTDSRQEQTA